MTIQQIKYKKEHCQVLLDTLKQGLSVVSFCAKVDISEATFYNWLKQYPDLRDVYELAKTHSRAWWDKKALDALEDKAINDRVLKLNMQNRAGWSDKLQSDNTHNITAHEQALLELAQPIED